MAVYLVASKAYFGADSKDVYLVGTTAYEMVGWWENEKAVE